MKTVELECATAPLADYAREARRSTVVVTRRGRPLAAVVPLDRVDWEDFVVSQDPKFLALLERSRASFKKHGGIPLESIEAEFSLPPRAVPAGPKTTPSRGRTSRRASPTRG